VILGGVTAFLGYVFFALGKRDLGKVCVNAAPILIFFGFIAIEVAIFEAYLQKTQTITLEACKETFRIEKMEDLPIFTTCVFTGYYPSKAGDIASVGFVTFVLFFWLLPFAFLFSFLYGLFKDTLSSFFGSAGPTVTPVITFIVATYGARQMIGGFLIDLFAYGSWGLVGIFIPLILAVGLKKILDSFFAVKVEEAVIWGAVGQDVWTKVAKTEEELKKTREALQGLLNTGQLTREEIDAMIGRLRGEKGNLQYLLQRKDLRRKEKAALEAELNVLNNEIESLEKIKGKLEEFKPR
jgi:hypothetical protein